MYACPCENCQRQLRENYANYSFGNFSDVSVNTQAVTNAPVQSTVVTSSSNTSVVITSPPSDAIKESNSKITVWIIIGILAICALGVGIYKYRQSNSVTNKTPNAQ